MIGPGSDKQKTVLTHTHFNSDKESHYKVFPNYFLLVPIGIHLTFSWTISVQLQYQQLTMKSKREVCEFKWRILVCFNTSPFTVVQRKKWGIYVQFDPRLHGQAISGSFSRVLGIWYKGLDFQFESERADWQHSLKLEAVSSDVFSAT